MKRLKFHIAAICVIFCSIWGSTLHAKIDTQDSGDRTEVSNRIVEAAAQLPDSEAKRHTTKSERFAQWYNWGNWSNWPNWRNWLNW